MKNLHHLFLRFFFGCCCVFTTCFEIHLCAADLAFTARHDHLINHCEIELEEIAPTTKTQIEMQIRKLSMLGRHRYRLLEVRPENFRQKVETSWARPKGELKYLTEFIPEPSKGRSSNRYLFYESNVPGQAMVFRKLAISMSDMVTTYMYRDRANAEPRFLDSIDTAGLYHLKFIRGDWETFYRGGEVKMEFTPEAFEMYREEMVKRNALLSQVLWNFQSNYNIRTEATMTLPTPIIYEGTRKFLREIEWDKLLIDTTGVSLKHYPDAK